jgi:hypothetical protein
MESAGSKLNARQCTAAPCQSMQGRRAPHCCHSTWTPAPPPSGAVGSPSQLPCTRTTIVILIGGATHLLLRDAASPWNNAWGSLIEA